MKSQSKEVPFPPMFDKKEGSLINGVELHTVKGVGFNQQPIKAMAYFINETKIAYLCGKSIIIYDLLTETQKSFSRSKEESGVSTFNCFKTMYGEEYIIYATKAGKNVYPQVSVLNVWKSQMKSYVLYDLDVESSITDLLLIGQGNRFVILSKQQCSSKFIIFNLDETTPFYNESIDLDVKGIFSLDSYSDQIYLYTNTEIYNLRYFKENSIQKIPLTLLPGQSIVDVKLASMSQYTFAVITDHGYLILKRILSGIQVRDDLGEFETMENDQVVFKRKMPSSLCVSESTIVIGYHLCEQITVVKIHNIDFNKRSIEQVKFNCPYLHKIVSMSFSQEYTSICLVVQLKQQDKYGIHMKIESEFLIKKGEEAIPKSTKQHSLPPGRIVPVVFNLVLHQTLMETFRSPIQPIMDDFVFHKSIININLVPYKKLILILSQDKKLRAMKMDITSISLTKLFLWEHQFNDQPITMDTHPSNFSVVFAFKQGVRIYTIGLEGIAPTFYWNVKGCDAVKFSTYGHILAVSTLSTVYLLNPYSTEQMYQFNIHIGPIKQLSFLNHDNYLYLQGLNGAINIYTMSGSRRLDYNNKATRSVASVYDVRNDMLVVSSTQGTTKFYKERGTSEFGSLWTYPCVITNILVINEFKCIILATSDGCIRIHQWPIVDFKHFQQNFTEKVLHDGPITNLKMSHDMSYLISSSDVSIYISKLQHFSQGLVTTQSEIINLVRSHNRDYLLLYHLDKLALCSYSAENLREEKILQIDADKADNQDVATQSITKENQDHRRNLSLIEAECNRIKTLKAEEFNNDINALALRRKKKEQEGKLKQITHKELLQTQDESTSETMLSLYRRHDSLLLLIQHLKTEQQLAIDKQKSEYAALQKVETDDYGKKIAKLEGNVNKIQSAYEYSMDWNDEEMNQKDQENEILKEQLKQKLNGELFQEEEKGTQLRKKNNRLLAENIRLKFRGKELATVMGEIEGEILDLYIEKKQHEENLGNIAKVLSQQDSIINHSEKRAKEYLKKNIVETNKEQYLSHRTQELESKNNELDIYLTEIEEKQKNMYEEFVKESLNKKEAVAKWGEYTEAAEKLKVTLKTLQIEKNQVKYSLQEMSSKIVNLLRDYPDGLEIEYQKLFEPDHKEIKIEVRKEVTNEEIQNKSGKVASLIANAQKKKKLNETNDSIRKNILVRANHEAIALTSECNQLRYQQVKLEQILKLLKKKLDEAKKSYDERASFSAHNLNISSIDDKNFKKKKLPFQLFQDENRIKRMYQLLVKDDLTESNLQNKIVLLNQLKKMEQSKLNDPKLNRKKSTTNDSSVMENTKINSEGNNSLSLPSIHKKAEFSMLLNSSMENPLIDTSNILGNLQ